RWVRPGREGGGEPAARREVQQRRIVFPEGVLGLEIDRDALADMAALEELLDLGEQVAEPAVQVGFLAIAVLEGLGGGIVQAVAQRNPPPLGHDVVRFVHVSSCVGCQVSMGPSLVQAARRRSRHPDGQPAIAIPSSTQASPSCWSATRMSSGAAPSAAARAARARSGRLLCADRWAATMRRRREPWIAAAISAAAAFDRWP